MTAPTAQENALEVMRAQLADWGIDSLYGDVVGYVTAGYDTDTINIRLQQTEAYKTRFAANTARRVAGMSVLSPAEYIATERQYRQVMQSAGLPSGFYDSTDDFTKFLSGDVSPVEVQDRVNLAVKQWTTASQDRKDIWEQEYGFTAGDAVAAILDTDVALPILERRAAAVDISVQAKRNGLAYSAGRGENLAAMGVTEDQAQNGYSNIGQTLATDSAIATRFGGSFNQDDAEQAQLLGTASAIRKRTAGAANEAALFRQNAGASSGSLSRTSNY